VRDFFCEGDKAKISLAGLFFIVVASLSISWFLLLLKKLYVFAMQYK
jgi:hypothetical protein